MASATASVELPSKEASLFKSTFKYFEHKQYKKGLKVCEQILKKTPTHGETIAMKGLFLGNVGRKEEGYECVRQGIKLNIKSHISWHVFGLLYRADKNYEEAMKCYRTALRIDKDNIQILRDLAVLQIQMRHYEGHAETRYALLSLRPNIRASWISIAVSYHLLKKHEQAVQVLDAYLESLVGDALNMINEADIAEVHLYKSQILEEAHMYERALEHLCGLRINRDCGFTKEFQIRRARVFLKLQRFAEAKTEYFDLVNDGAPNNRECLDGLFYSQQIGSLVKEGEKREKDIENFYAPFLRKDGRVQIVPYLELLNRVSGDCQKTHLIFFVQKMLAKGVDSTFRLVRFILSTKGGRDTFKQVVNEMETGNITFNQAIFIGQYYDSQGNYREALSWYENAYRANGGLGMTVDLFLHLARLFRHCGMTKEASKCTEKARLMEPSDRSLNTKSVKYLLRNGQLEEAKRTVALFLKKSESLDEQMQDLVEMEGLWFAYEAALCLVKAGRIEEAFVYLDQIHKHFDDFWDDQFDFHHYAIRRMTLCSYIRLLRFEDVVYGQKPFKKAARLALLAILKLAGAKMNFGIDSVCDQMNELCQQVSELTLVQPKTNGTNTEVLKKGKRWIDKLLQYCPDELETLTLSFDYYYASGKALLCLQALFRLKKVESENAQLEFVKRLLAMKLLKADRTTDKCTNAIKMLFGEVVGCTDPTDADLIAMATRILKRNQDRECVSIKRVDTLRWLALIEPQFKPLLKEELDDILTRPANISLVEVGESIRSTIDGWGTNKASFELNEEIDKVATKIRTQISLEEKIGNSQFLEFL